MEVALRHQRTVLGRLHRRRLAHFAEVTSTPARRTRDVVHTMVTSSRQLLSKAERKKVGLCSSCCLPIACLPLAACRFRLLLPLAASIVVLALADG